MKISLIAALGLAFCAPVLGRPTEPSREEVPPPKAVKTRPTAESLVAAGNRHYYQGNTREAQASYARAIAVSSGQSAEAWLNGAVALEELGRPQEALRWYASAVPVAGQQRFEALNALGWAHLRVGQYQEAEEKLEEVLRSRRDHPHALLGRARLELMAGNPSQALVFLEKAHVAAPLLNLVSFYKGQAYGQRNEAALEIESYRQAVTADSYFVEAREALARAYLRQKQFHQAYRQFARILDAEPRHRRVEGLISKLRRFAAGTMLRSPGQLGVFQGYSGESRAGRGRVPAIRAGVGTDSLGRPRLRSFMAFSVNGPVSILEGASGRKLAQGKAGDSWMIRPKLHKGQWQLELFAEKTRILAGKAVVVRPDSPARGLITLDPARGRTWPEISDITDKSLRGELEVSLDKRRSLKLVNVVNLEDYTHGVLSAEMPIASPVEALKAQAVVARSHALFIIKVSQRHKKHGYDVCDGQHCQVYAGVRAESPRSRAVVDATRGKIVTWQGKVAHVIYMSNCGGHTQSGKEVGWGDVPYWNGVRDAPGLSRPDSPWELRQWLSSMPQSYCQPSNHVHPAHYRWTRVVPFADIEAKVRRRYPALGKLAALRTLKRSDSGNLNALLIAGSKGRTILTSEMGLRGLLGVGSLRSTLFVMDVEYERAKGGELKPKYLVFHGGGWGHGVGLCQSGAMGRSEAGQTYEEIIKGYFPGIQMGELNYY